LARQRRGKSDAIEETSVRARASAIQRLGATEMQVSSRDSATIERAKGAALAEHGFPSSALTSRNSFSKGNEAPHQRHSSETSGGSRQVQAEKWRFGMSGL
jgi:hypothetical protein